MLAAVKLYLYTLQISTNLQYHGPSREEYLDPKKPPSQQREGMHHFKGVVQY